MIEMPSTTIYLSEEKQAKAIYVQEQVNLKLPFTKQKTLSKLFQDWIEARLDLEDVKPQIEKLSEKA